MSDVCSRIYSKDIPVSGFQCQLCTKINFNSQKEFSSHLRKFHCSQEGGSFVCLYGPNNVCSSLPLEGVSDQDYEHHVLKHHIWAMHSKGNVASMTNGGNRRKGSGVEGRWGVFSSTQNIPAVLNDPRTGMKRDFFTKTWGEEFIEANEIVSHTELPEISSRHFDSYLRKLRKRQQLLRRWANKELAEAESRSAANVNSPSGRVLDVSQHVPHLFLTSSFDLRDPSTFYAVFTHITASGISRKNSKSLQDKLFSFLEVVESDMSEQIARKSSAFFDTMTYLNAQMDQLGRNHSAVLTLREGIADLRQQMVVRPMRISSLPVRRANIRVTQKKLEGMSTVREVQSTIQIMLARQEYSSALDLITTTQDLLSSELSSIKSLRHLNSELCEYVRVIDKMVSEEFLKYVSDDLNRPLKSSEVDTLDEDQLFSIVFAILRLQKCEFVDRLRTEVNVTVNASVKQTVAEALSQVESDHESTNLADQAKELPFPLWLSVLAQLTKQLQIIIKRVQSLVRVVDDAVEASAGHAVLGPDGTSPAILSMAASDPVITSSSCTKLRSRLKDVISSASEYAHDRCAKLMHARSRDDGFDKMSAAEFLTLSRVVESFAEETQKVSGVRYSPLRMGLQGQATRFVARFHEERETRLKLNLNAERWKSVSVPKNLQTLVDHVTESGVLEFPKAAEIDEEAAKAEANLRQDNLGSRHSSALSGPSSSSHSLSSADDAAAKSVRVGGDEYVVVGVCLVVVRLIVEYAECASTLKMAAQQLLTRLVDLLRKFNADTCRLLIEAGAVSLGLKTITTRHLALALRSLELLLTLFPRLLTHFGRDLSVTSVDKHVGQLSREYREHCEAIERKIVGVMGDSLEQHLESWEAKSPVPSKSFNEIMKSLSKLHETVSSILPQSQVDHLFTMVTSALKSKLGARLIKLSVSPVGPQSWVVMSELTFYFNHVSNLSLTLEESQEQFISQLWKSQNS